MKEDKNEINQVLPIKNEFPKKKLLNYFLKNETFTENSLNPISKCINDYTQINFLLELDQTKSITFFFFLALLLVNYYTKKIR